MGLTARWPPATARATLPHTSVDATTVVAAGCAELPIPQAGSVIKAADAVAQTALADSQRVTLTSAIRRSIPYLPAHRPKRNTNENRFH